MPKVYNLGHDIVNKDAFHLKNWSYVFMKEFEAKNYDRLYVTIQPAAITIHTNILGFKSLYFLKDKLNLITSTDKAFELQLHTFQKIPKAVLYIGLSLALFFLVKNLYGLKVSLLFITLFSLEPYVLGHSRVIQTDGLATYLVFTTVLLLLYIQKLHTHKQHIQSKQWYFFTALSGILIGTAVVEKSSTLIVVPVILFFLAYYTKVNFKTLLKTELLFIVSFLCTMVIIFPAFWGDFWFTAYRLTYGSFLHGVRGIDAETFSYAATPHIHPFSYYPRVLYNKISGLVLVGLVIGIIVLFTKRKTLKLSHFISPLLFTPAVWLLIHQLSTKKIDRYMLLLFPFLILAATLALTYALEKYNKKAVYYLLVLLVVIRLFQFSTLFPDFLLFKNPLSLDFSYATSETAWGSGMYKLGKHLETTYGSDKIVVIPDASTLYLYYSGEVLNLDEVACAVAFDLLILSGDTEKTCIKERTEYIGNYTVVNDLSFSIYKSK